jgi:hypothetical protein
MQANEMEKHLGCYHIDLTSIKGVFGKWFQIIAIRSAPWTQVGIFLVDCKEDSNIANVKTRH